LFTNLIKNSIEAAEEQQKAIHILIKTHVEGDQIKIEINDKSGGIPERVVPQMFNPNFTTKSSGTGLGLAICKGIVEKADGVITYTTTTGIGTSFFIVLPLAKN
jgi:two-component system, NtrC family, nitrogen regulation sensor histidine kinase NtrY